MRILKLILFLLVSLSAFGQRFDSYSFTTTSPTTPGAQKFVLAAPGATIAVCSHPANATPCTNYATTYTDSSLTVSCSTATQLVANGSTTCAATSDTSGNWGFWAQAGQYDYTITYNGVSVGPYTATIAPGTSGPTAWSGQQTFNGGFVSNALNVGTRYVGSLFAGDLGTQANTQAAILNAAGGGELVIAAQGSLSYSTTIAVPSNVWIHGQGPTTILNFTGASSQCITAIGTSGAHLSNIRISSLTCQNGTAGTTLTAGRDGIRAEWVDGLEVDHVSMNGIAGAFGVMFKNSTNVKIVNNDIENVTYSGIFGGLGNNGAVIANNKVKNVTTTAAGVGYGIVAAGAAESGADAGVYGQNILVTGNYVSGVPHWEALDAHGGVNVTFANNYVENSFVCALIALQYSGLNSPAVPVMNDIHFVGNTCVQGTGDINGRAIIAEGDSFPQPTNGFWIEDNDITGYGATSSASATTLGVIDVREANNAHVARNHIHSWNQYGVYLSDVIGGEVVDNVFENMNDKKSVASAMVYPDVGNYSIDVAGNHGAWDSTHQPNYLLRVNAQSNNITVTKPNWADNSPATADYTLWSPCCYSGTNPPGTTNKLTFKSGDKIWDTFGRQWWSGTGTDGFWSQDTSTVISTCNMTSGSPNMTGCSGGLGGATYFYYFPIGMHVTVAGAGVAAAALNAKVIGYTSSGTSVTGVVLDTNASTSVVGTNVTFQNSPNGIVSEQYLTEWETKGTLSPVQGQQWTYDYGNAAYTNGSSFGFEFGTNNGGFYGTYNVRQTTRNTDSWTSTNAAQPNYLLDVNNAGLSLWYAAAGTSPATKATFYGVTPAWQCTNLGCLWGGGLAVPNSSFVMQNVGTFTTGASPYTASVSSTFHITSSSHCVVNAADATSAAYTGVSVAPGTNQIVLTYTGTSGHPVWFECSAL